MPAIPLVTIFRPPTDLESDIIVQHADCDGPEDGLRYILKGIAKAVHVESAIPIAPFTLLRSNLISASFALPVVMSVLGGLCPVRVAFLTELAQLRLEILRHPVPVCIPDLV